MRLLVAAALTVAWVTGLGAADPQAIRPDKRVKLFNGRDLSGFYT